MMRINNLEIEGFMSYRERQIIVFPRQGAILFAGRWKDKPVSSGSGKSSLIHAITFALGIGDLPATTLKNWYSKKLYVSLTLCDDETGYEVEIIRDPKLQLVENGKPYVGLSGGAEERLSDILKANPDLVKALTHRPQREKGHFINSTDSEIKTFLSTLLSLSKVEDAGDISAKLHTELKTQLDLLDRDIENATANLKLLEVSTEERQQATAALVAAKARLQEFDNQAGRVAQALEEIASLTKQITESKNAIQSQINQIKSDETAATRKINADIQGLRSQLEAVRTNVSTQIYGLQEQIKAARAAIVQKSNVEIQQLRSEIENARKSISAQITGLQGQINAARTSATETARKLISDINNVKMLEINSANCDLANDSIKKQLLVIKEEIDKIKSCRCYACQRVWQAGDPTGATMEEQQRVKTAEAKSLIEELQTNSAKIKSAVLVIASKPELERQLAAANALAANPLPEVDAQIKELQAKPVAPEIQARIVTLESAAQAASANPLPEVEAQIKELQAKPVAPEIQTLIASMEVERDKVDPARAAAVRELMSRLTNPLPEADARIQKLHQGMAVFSTAKADAALSLDSAKLLMANVDRKVETFNSSKKKLENLQAMRISLARKEFVERHTAAMLSRSGFLSVIFDEVLAEIESRTNGMLNKISNVSGITMKLDSARSTKAGALKKVIAIKFFKNGIEVPSIKGLSGGQQCVIELCADIAVAKCIRNRCGSHLGWLMLDEALDGLDTEPKREALEMLKSEIDGQIIVIDHSTEVKEGFELIVQVEYDGRDSYVV